METNTIWNPEEEETTIDLLHFAASMAKQWRKLIVWCLTGLLLGTALLFVPKAAAEESQRSREDSALLEQMHIAAQARARYDELNAYVRNSQFMQLNGQTAFTGKVEFYIPSAADPDQIAASYGAQMNSETVRQTLCQLLGITDETDLDKMYWHNTSVREETQIVEGTKVGIREKISLTAGFYAATKEQAQQAVEYLVQTIQTLPEAVSPRQDFTLIEISAGVQSGAAATAQTGQSVSQPTAGTQNNAVDLQGMQRIVRDELSAAYKTCTDLEKAFDEEQFAIYQEYVLTGKTDELPLELMPSNPLKKPVLITLVFCFVGCGWYAVAYICSGKIKTADQLCQLTRRNVLALVSGAQPKKNGLDRWLDDLQMRSFPAAVSQTYVKAALEKMENPVVIFDQEDPELAAVVKEMAGVPAMGLVSRDAKTLEQVKADAQLLLVVKLEGTTVEAVRQECALYRQYGLNLAGTILVR